MKALSIRQPWAWLICKGYKDIENRDWFTGFRGRIYVHAGKIPDDDAWDFVEDRLDYKVWDAIWDMTWLDRNLTKGALIGEVDIVDCVSKSESRWFVGKYGFVLKNPVLYDKPIFCRGRLGFFEVKRSEI